MRTAVASLALLAGVSARNLHDRQHYEAKFVEWMQEHNVHFESGDEFVKRLSIFAENDDYITTENARNLSYELGHNKYSIYTNEEFQELMGLNRPMPERPAPIAVRDAVGANPDSVDWVSAGAVTGVKDQGNCGSCWSFSTTGCVEGAYKLTFGKLNSYSEQQLVDCDTVDQGCNGGWMDDAFAWIQKNGGICFESDYPYTSGTTATAGTCQTSCTNVPFTVKGWTDLATNEAALESGVALQPVSVAIDASCLAFQLYKTGVFTNSCGIRLDHGVLAVGYGYWTDGTPYWRVKNSWGTGWGMGGYIYMKRTPGGTGVGICGIARAASYITLA